MVQTHVINPLTGRRIAIGKNTYKRVMKLRDNVLTKDHWETNTRLEQETGQK